MESETRTAFWKGVKFWLVLAIAGLLAAMLWGLWADGGGDGEGGAPASTDGARASEAISAPRTSGSAW